MIGIIVKHSLNNKMNSISIRKLEKLEEIKELISVFSLAFESYYDTKDEYLHLMLKNTTCVILGAVFGSRIVGGLVAFEITPIHGKKELYIYDIAVHPKFQKQGVGKKLMEIIKEEARTRDIGTIFVEAESEDQGAVAFYRAIGGEEVTVNHFNFTL